ncbi:MAG: ferrous iron transport protein B [Leptospiraceae bacterium]|nr:ferrous iron transport protein B [Leptospiraceae bacterium]
MKAASHYNLIPGRSMKAAVRVPQIALIGNPNAGKTTLFNAICGYRQKTANYPGATIDLKRGYFGFQGQSWALIDLPGLYSLQATSIDERIALDVLYKSVLGIEKIDAIVCVIDATNLKRNLLLLTQLCELGIPMMVVLSMADVLHRRGQKLDLKQLSAELQVPLVALNARKPESIVELREQIIDTALQASIPHPLVQFPATWYDLIDRLPADTRVAEWKPEFALSYLAQGRFEHLHGQLRQHLDQVRTELQGLPDYHPATMTSRRYRWIEQVYRKVFQSGSGGPGLSSRLDAILTHRLLGLAVFALIMFFVFTSIYTWASPLMDGIDALFGALQGVVEGLLIDMPLLSSLIADGVIGGLGSVLIFLPQILILFLFIAILEDSGYMARAAFLVDRMLAWAGLNGRAFIPMLSSYACAVPAIMAARVMTNPRARLTTILVSPLVSCSARLPVYVLMIGALIEPAWGSLWAAVALFGFHLLGLVIALPVAFVLNRGILKTPATPFLLELPPYHLPELRTVFFKVFDAGKRFVLQTGAIILAMSIIIWALSFFPRDESRLAAIQNQYDQQIQLLQSKAQAAGTDPDLTELEARRDHTLASAQLQQSYLGQFGIGLQPLFAPLGFDWKITVGILASFPARELIISTLGIIYNVGDTDENDLNLRQRMLQDRHADGRPVFTPLVAISLMIFFALCSQCMSTLATAYRELKSLKWVLFMFGYMTILAYGLAMLVYQGGLLAGMS